MSKYISERKSAASDDWELTIAKFLVGSLPEREFKASARLGNPGVALDRQCQALFYSGTKHSIDGNDAAAKQEFIDCIKTGVKGAFEYTSAKSELERLKKGK